MSSIEVLSAGLLTTVQDRGRLGYAHLGVPRSGAADRVAHDLANRLVGNLADAAALETTASGCRLRARGPLTIAVTGARCGVFVGGVSAPWGAPFRVASGQAIEIGPARTGLRSSVAFRGGIEVEPVLGSRSTDTLSGLGPSPLRAGDELAVGAEQQGPEVRFGGVSADAESWAPGGSGHADEVRVLRGPRWGWLGGEGWEALLAREWRVSADSNRIGVRLEGEALARAGRGEIASEGMVSGAIQLPPSGLPVIFLADHPTTGGYPVVAVVASGSMSVIAQAAPGAVLRLTESGAPGPRGGSA